MEKRNSHKYLREHNTKSYLWKSENLFMQWFQLWNQSLYQNVIFSFHQKIYKICKKKNKKFCTILNFFFLKDGQIYIMKRKRVLLAPNYVQPMHNQLHEFIEKVNTFDLCWIQKSIFTLLIISIPVNKYWINGIRITLSNSLGAPIFPQRIISM